MISSTFSTFLCKLMLRIRRSWASQKVSDLAMIALVQSRYRQSQSWKWGGEHGIKFDIGYPPSIVGYSETTYWRGTNSIIEAKVPLRWYCCVYKRGLALVDGYFVLDILDVLAEDKDKMEYIVLAGRQGRGFKVYSAKARVFAEGGKFHLRWIKE